MDVVLAAGAAEQAAADKAVADQAVAEQAVAEQGRAARAAWRVRLPTPRPTRM